MGMTPALGSCYFARVPLLSPYARLVWPLSLIFSAICATGCGSSTAENPPPNNPPPVQQPPPEPVKETPKAPLLLVRPIRSVDTPRVPKAKMVELSKKLSDDIFGSGKYTLAATSTAGGSANADCLTEACEMAAAKDALAKEVLHTRLVQYAEQCVLLSVLYDSISKKNLWAFARAFPCDAAGAENAVSTLGAAFTARSNGEPSGPVFAVAPVQHDINDIAWASESFAEYLTTLIAARGRTVVPASDVASHLAESKKEPNRSCADKNCAISLATAAAAELSVATKITKKKTVCTIATSIYDVATKTSSASASAEGGCAAADIAGGLKTIAGTLISEAAQTDLR